MAFNLGDLLPLQQLIADLHCVVKDLLSGDKVHIHVIVSKHYHFLIKSNAIKSNVI